jgi:hypothetical protein
MSQVEYTPKVQLLIIMLLHFDNDDSEEIKHSHVRIPKHKWSRTVHALATSEVIPELSPSPKTRNPAYLYRCPISSSTNYGVFQRCQSMDEEYRHAQIWQPRFLLRGNNRFLRISLYTCLTYISISIKKLRSG